MLKFLILFLLVYVQAPVFAQTVSQKLLAAFSAFQHDSQMKNGIASLCVMDAKTGKIIVAKNEKTGLVPASTLKVITAASAYQILGKDFRYQTKFAFRNTAAGTDLLVLPAGDPTFGSWRWQNTTSESTINNLVTAIKKAGINTVNSLAIGNSNWNEEVIPDGWLWQDIGNYYGAGAGKLNWHENQYDVILRSGSRVGSPVTISKIKPTLYNYQLHSEVKAAAAGSGDSAYIYFPVVGNTATIRGTIPVNKSAFEISGAMPFPADQFSHAFFDQISKNNLKIESNNWKYVQDQPDLNLYTVFHSVTSPSLDSLIYFLNRKSVNLYAEALLKAIAEKQTGTGSTGKGVYAMQQFWKQQGISESEMAVFDGSGLSPVNRVTTEAQVTVLAFARKQNWFTGFYNSLPTYNGLKMKSGTMHGVKGFCGYARDSSGNEYIFSFIVNNYSGSSSAITHKMYKVLDVLK